METAELTKEEKKIAKKVIQNPLAAMRAMVTGSLFRFIVYFWDTYSSEAFVPNWHIKYLCEELEIVARRVGANLPKLYDLIINVPPGSTKTALVSIFFPVWCWVNWLHLKIIATSHSDPLSLESAEYCRDIVRSEKFKEMFPEIDIKDDKDKKSNFRIVKKIFKYPGRPPRIEQGGARISTSVGAKITGFHGHIIIPDDIIDPKGAISDAKIREANHYLDQTLSTRKVNKKVSVMIMIMQRLSQNDPTGHLLTKTGKKVKHISLPGEIVNYEKHLKPEFLKEYYTDGLLDPVRLGWKELEDLEEDLGQYGYAGQIGQAPTPIGGGMFKVDQLIHVESIPTEVVKTVRFWDKAGTPKEKTTVDKPHTAGVKMGVLKDGRFIVLDVERGQWASNVREDRILAVANADSTKTVIGIEQEPGSGGKESAENTVKNLAGYRVKTDRPTGDKVYRADPFSVQVNRGNVLILKGAWNQKYEDEMENFPFGRTKDQIDASAGAFNILTGRLKRRAKVLRK